jgi:peptide chain release factor 2
VVRTYGRGDWIRTNDLLHPMQARYRAALHPDRDLNLAQGAFGFNSTGARLSAIIPSLWKNFKVGCRPWQSAWLASWCGFDLPAQQNEAEALQQQSADPGFWDNPQKAQVVMRRLSAFQERIASWHSLSEGIRTTSDLIGLALEEGDQELLESLAQDALVLFDEAESREVDVVLSGEYDDHSAIIAIHAGAGGTESQDWAQMLLRMYTRWADDKGYRPEVLEHSPGEEAGIKSVTLEVSGAGAYGYAKAERGVHRLVRLSPFDSAHARHTSFALVEVLPEAESDIELVIGPDDLRIDTFKASGAGGQHVQKNSTAVRITHIPSRLVVSCQNERSQLQNKETAMKILRARLMEREIARRAQERADLKGKHVAAGWGNQIRSYVLHPYKRVKDHRSGYETTDPEQVLDGELDPLIRAYLLSSIEQE